jgi:hypothetical protein
MEMHIYTDTNTQPRLIRRTYNAHVKLIRLVHTINTHIRLIGFTKLI